MIETNKTMAFKTDMRYINAIVCNMHGIIAGYPFERVWPQIVLGENLGPLAVQGDQVAAVLFSILKQYTANSEEFYEETCTAFVRLLIRGTVTMERNENDALTPANGMIVFNTSVNRFQGYFNGAWGNLHGWGDPAA